MTGSVQKKLQSMLEARGLALEAFTDEPEEMTNREARELMRFLEETVSETTSKGSTESGDVA